MNTYKILNISTTSNVEGLLTQLRFDVLAMSAGGIPAEGTRVETFNPPGDPISSISESDLKKLCESIANSTGMYKFLDEVIARMTGPISAVPLAPLPPPESVGMSEGQYRPVWASQIDTAVATIYAQYSRFEIEYKEKRAAAEAFIADNYEGTPAPWVMDYALSANLTYKDAADAILREALKWEDALPKLGALRVQKYLILNAETLTQAREEFDRLVSAIQAIQQVLQ